jgi:hypothetical protein
MCLFLPLLLGYDWIDLHDQSYRVCPLGIEQAHIDARETSKASKGIKGIKEAIASVDELAIVSNIVVLMPLRVDHPPAEKGESQPFGIHLKMYKALHILTLFFQHLFELRVSQIRERKQKLEDQDVVSDRDIERIQLLSATGRDRRSQRSEDQGERRG